MIQVCLFLLTRPQLFIQGKGPFDNLNWQESHISIHYVDRKAHLSDWEDFQVYRKTFGVSTTNDSRAAH